MADQHRRVAAESAAHAQGLADNLAKQGFRIETRTSDHWTLRKSRRRRDEVVTIVISRRSMLAPPPPPSSPPYSPPR